MMTEEQLERSKVVHFDAETIEKESLSLPEAMRESYIWLKNYTRDECNRDVELLTRAFKEVGVDHDRGTWVKVFKGRWKRNAGGEEIPSPIISQEKFLQAVSALRDNVRVESLRGKVPFIQTKIWKQVKAYYDMRRRPEWINGFGMIIGPTGMMKTACQKEYCRLNNHGTCVWMEAPENGSLKEFITVLAGRYGVSSNRSHEEKRNKIFSTANHKKSIFLDNAQALYREKKGTDQVVFNLLRRLNDETGVKIFLSITEEFERTLMNNMLLGYFEQFEGRSGGRKSWLRLPAQVPEEDVLAIAQKMGLLKAEKHLQALVGISQMEGRVRTLFEVLQTAKYNAEADQQKFTFEYVLEEIE